MAGYSRVRRIAGLALAAACANAAAQDLQDLPQLWAQERDRQILAQSACARL